MGANVVVDGTPSLILATAGQVGIYTRVGEEPNIEALSVTANGTYTATGDGYNPVVVAVNAEVEALSVSANGSYTADGDGFNPVTVNVQPTLEALTATANGSYTPSGDGYSAVTVAIPTYDGSYSVTPTTTAQTLATSGKVMTQDVVINKTESGVRLYSSKNVEAYKYYDVFNDFRQAVFPDLPMDKDIVIIEFENNTSNKRAGIYWVQVKMPKTNQVTSYGSRVGGSFGGNMGCDVYAGATINVYVGEYQL